MVLYYYEASLLNNTIWSSEMATVYYGMCHTFLYPDKITNTEEFVFYLYPGLNYRVFVHDPRYYMIGFNPLTTPRILLELNSGQNNMKPGHFEWFMFSVTEHNLINRPEQPCHEEEEGELYDYLKCVKTSQARRAGCRPWTVSGDKRRTRPALEPVIVPLHQCTLEPLAQ